MQAKLRCAKYMYATTMVTKSGTTMVTPVAPLPTALQSWWCEGAIMIVLRCNFDSVKVQS